MTERISLTIKDKVMVFRCGNIMLPLV